MTSFLGRAGNHLLFADGDNAVIVDARVAVVTASGATEEFKTLQEWGDGEFSEADTATATAALGELSDPLPESTGRMYTVPRGVQAAARSGLKAATGKSISRPSIYTGTILAAGGQISFNELANIASYFDRNTEAGAVGDDDVTYRLHGGDSARKWASAIVEREPVNPSPEFPIEKLRQMFSEDPETGPEFLARVGLNGEGIDRLYRVDLDNRTYVWDDHWTDLGHSNWTVWDYDKALDANREAEYSTHVIIDPESAVKLASRFSNGEQRVYVEDLDLYESSLVRDAASEIDWELLDSTVVAAGGIDNTPGVYDSTERSANASKQVRDANGKFVKMGARVMVGNNPQATGTISRINDDGTVEVSMESGGSQVVAADQVAEPGTVRPIPGRPEEIKNVDFSGILAEPRTPINRTEAQIPGTLPRMTSDDLHSIINNFPAWVKKQRDAFAPLPNNKNKPVQGKNSTSTGGVDVAMDASEHPLIREWLKRKDRASRDNKMWYNPILAAAVPPAGEDLTPETSDVQPVYLAVVSPDDPRAVFSLLSLVPKSTSSPAPAVYARQDGKWVLDQQSLNDLNSATPPPVVPLSGDILNDTLKQVDESQGVGEQEEPAEAETEEQAREFSLSVLWGPRRDLMDAVRTEWEAITAAGGADRNRGGAEKLRRYWTVGPGGAKIAWGTPGDWTRCVRHLGKYLGARADGYCALRHKEMTGMWTGDKEHAKTFSSNLYGATLSTDALYDLDKVIADSVRRATAADIQERVHSITASGAPHFHAGPYKSWKDVPEQAITAAAGDGRVGGAFFIPLALPEGIFSGDGRLVEKYAATIRNLPISLLWQVQTAKGHDGSYVVGRIERLGRTPLGIGGGYGHFDVGPWGREAERMVRNGMLRFVSADMDEFEAEIDSSSEASEDDEKKIKNGKTIIKGARVMAVTIVAKPAFQEATIQMVPDLVLQEENVYPDGIYSEQPLDPIEAAAITASAAIADAIPVTPPKDWFHNPRLSGPTPLTIDDNGHVFGHIAAWHSGHINPQLNGINPPRSKSGYAYFHTGVVRTMEGNDIPVGQLTLAGGHAGLSASAAEAVKHYDDTGSAFADVHAGEDEWGIWVAGALRPGITPAQVRQARAAAPSGDWRPIRGNHELVAVCQVNVPGFPIARAFVASGHMEGIVAAGAAVLAQMKSDPLAELTARLEAVEQFSERELSSRASELSARVQPVKDEHLAELSSRSEAVLERMSTFGYVSKKSREEAAEKGEALSDGSYPIRNVSDLKNAIQAYGRAKESDRAKVRRHIIKRARALGKADLIPDNWKTAQSEGITASLESMRTRVEAGRAAIVAAAALTEEEKRRKELEETPGGQEPDPKGLAPESEEDGGQKYKPGYQPRDYNGQFRDVLARLKENLGDSGNQQVVEKIKETDAKADAGDYAKAVKAGVDLKGALDRLDSGALNKEAIGSVREASRELGKVIANLPLPFDNQAQKVRYSDLPPTLRELMEDFIKRVEDKIGTKDAAPAVQKLKSFMSGGDMFSQSEVSQEMSKLLRLLT